MSGMGLVDRKTEGNKDDEPLIFDQDRPAGHRSILGINLAVQQKRCASTIIFEKVHFFFDAIVKGDGSSASSVVGLVEREFVCVGTFGCFWPLRWLLGRTRYMPLSHPHAHATRSCLCNYPKMLSLCTNMPRRVVPSVRVFKQ